MTRTYYPVLTAARALKMHSATGSAPLPFNLGRNARLALCEEVMHSATGEPLAALFAANLLTDEETRKTEQALADPAFLRQFLLRFVQSPIAVPREPTFWVIPDAYGSALWVFRTIHARLVNLPTKR